MAGESFVRPSEAAGVVLRRVADGDRREQPRDGRRPELGARPHQRAERKPDVDRRHHEHRGARQTLRRGRCRIQARPLRRRPAATSSTASSDTSRGSSGSWATASTRTAAENPTNAADNGAFARVARPTSSTPARAAAMTATAAVAHAGSVQMVNPRIAIRTTADRMRRIRSRYRFPAAIASDWMAPYRRSRFW